MIPFVRNKGRKHSALSVLFRYFYGEKVGNTPHFLPIFGISDPFIFVVEKQINALQHIQRPFFGLILFRPAHLHKKMPLGYV